MTQLKNQHTGALACRGVAVSLGGAPVLQDVDLNINPGERVAFIGPSGAGKTTLLRLFNGMVIPSAGRVEVGGRNLAGLTGRSLQKVRHAVGFVHQDLRLVPNLRVSQNVLNGRLGGQNVLQSLAMFLRPASGDLDEVYHLLERVGIPDKMFERTDTLSGGEAQRVAVARALIQHPVVLAADEPVASVDPARAREILALLTGLSQEHGLTLCVSLHDPTLVREFFPRTIGMRAGRIVFDLATEVLDDDRLATLYTLEADDGL